MTATMTLTAIDWTANQSSNRPAAFFVLSQTLRSAGGTASGVVVGEFADKSDMCFIFRNAKCASYAYGVSVRLLKKVLGSSSGGAAAAAGFCWSCRLHRESGRA
jgi:hypothetical protein